MYQIFPYQCIWYFCFVSTREKKKIYYGVLDSSEGKKYNKENNKKNNKKNERKKSKRLKTNKSNTLSYINNLSYI